MISSLIFGITELSRSNLSFDQFRTLYEKCFMFFWNIGVAWNVTRSKNLDEMLNKMLNKKYKNTYSNSFKFV